MTGVTNRVLARFVRRAYLPFEGAEGAYAQDAIRRFGVPLRAQFYPRPFAPAGATRILVLGGSQGASALNERLPEAFALLRGKEVEVSVVHQTGEGRDGAVRVAYANHGFSAVTVTPFLKDAAEALANCDLVIARAGSGTVAEICAVGRGSILIPFPHAADDHQTANAAGLVAQGGAVCLRQEAADPPRIAEEVASLCRDRTKLAHMADAARALGHPDAALAIAQDLVDLGGLRKAS